MRHATIHIHDGGDATEVEPNPAPARHNVLSLIVTVGDTEVDATLTEIERRELIKALGGQP